jgi:hypothetical protein
MTPCLPRPRQRQAGGLVLMLPGLAGAGVLATIAYGSYCQIARAALDKHTHPHPTGLLGQPFYTLATEATTAMGMARPSHWPVCWPWVMVGKLRPARVPPKLTPEVVPSNIARGITAAAVPAPGDWSGPTRHCKAPSISRR